MVQDKKIQEAALLGEETTLLTILIDYGKDLPAHVKSRLEAWLEHTKEKQRNLKEQ